jgi:cytochrome c-type biogenesis protein CcmH/NrfG
VRAIRFLLALLVTTAAIALIVRGILPRIECNREKGRINREVRRFARSGDEQVRLSQARNNVLVCRRCLATYPEDFQLHMLMAANLNILGNTEEALQSYARAVAIAERPEIYAQMAEIEIEHGNIEAARQLLVKTALFNVVYIDIVDEPLRSEIIAEVLARHARLRAARK